MSMCVNNVCGVIDGKLDLSFSLEKGSRSVKYTTILNKIFNMNRKQIV